MYGIGTYSTSADCNICAGQTYFTVHPLLRPPSSFEKDL